MKEVIQSRRPSSSTSGRRPACAARSAGRRGRSHPPLRGARHWPPTGASSTSSRTSERASRRPDPACAPIASPRSAGAAPIEAPTPAAAACPLPSDRRQDRARVLTTSVSTILADPVASSQGRRTLVTRAQRRAQGGPNVQPSGAANPGVGGGEGAGVSRQATRGVVQRRPADVRRPSLARAGRRLAEVKAGRPAGAGLPTPAAKRPVG